MIWSLFQLLSTWIGVTNETEYDSSYSFIHMAVPMNVLFNWKMRKEKGVNHDEHVEKYISSWWWLLSPFSSIKSFTCCCSSTFKLTSHVFSSLFPSHHQNHFLSPFPSHYRNYQNETRYWISTTDEYMQQAEVSNKQCEWGKLYADLDVI